MRTVGFRTREEREAFLREHVEEVYAELTGGFGEAVRVEELVFRAADRYPGLVPGREAMAEERGRRQSEKRGLELDQALFLSRVLGSPRAGRHLVHAMMRPRPEALGRIEEFRRLGRVDLGLARVERRGRIGLVELANPRFLNAEDDGTTAGLEVAVDLVLLDPEVEVGVLRGAVVDHPRYAGRRVFNSGINLTHLYHGRITFVDFFVARELGLVGKLYRGHWLGDDFQSCLEETEEKPWIAAVEAHAIGGGCQLLLVMDRVLAERGSFFSLPASKEGIIPGTSNRRLTRFVGDRLARQLIVFERRLEADSPEGRLICDEVVEPGAMDEAIERDVARLLGSGLVSAAANRKAIRLGEETLDDFRRYQAVYAREQARCLYSPALISNLERNWQAHRRRP
ncbi:MAG TPA: enoyl-CoA hydratase/isomerase family protein [Candidatus Dormibacteraeota bacterium]|nr:enoyl-CoA hydratase/isomerase family protein [Candidatus Dormibacteraeota bacterium]